jgi:predicted nucleic acid-binding protein
MANRLRLVINAVIYSKVPVHYSQIEDLEAALPKSLFDPEPIPYEAAFLAGKSFLAYRRKGRTRRSPLPDFFVGAHAAVAGYRLLTRDAARYRTYFPELPLITPN